MSNLSEIYLAGGCFWGTEHFLKFINGVEYTQVGYANGESPNPTYQEVCKGAGHVETVKVVYNQEVVSLSVIINLFFKTIDPTSINRQGADEGVQYRTGIYYINANHLKIIEAEISNVAKKYSKPIVVEVMPLKNFFPAEDYHQHYLEKNTNGYCHIDPSLFALAKKANR